MTESRASRADAAIRLSMTAVVLGVAAVAGWVSYQHAHDVVLTHGEDPATARLVPLTVDGLVFASSMVMLHCARHQLPVPALARALLTLGVAATLAANLLHGAGNGIVGAVIAAWPAVALVGSYELLMEVIRTGGPSADAYQAHDVPLLGGRMAGDGQTSPGMVNDRPDIEADTADPYTSAVRLLAERPDLSGAELGRRLQVSTRHGRRLRTRIIRDRCHSTEVNSA